jgi:hypothetical protein
VSVGHDLERLAGLLPPPACEVTAPPWQAAEVELGFAFPADFRAFVERYGTGEITRPARNNPNVGVTAIEVHAISRDASWGRAPGFRGFGEMLDSVHRTFSGAPAEDFSGVVYGFHPDPGGMVSWGTNEAGDEFFWLPTGSDSDQWPVVMWARGPVEAYRFEGGMVKFLLALFDGDHPASSLLGGAGIQWTMHADWLHQGFDVSAGPA